MTDIILRTQRKICRQRTIEMAEYKIVVTTSNTGVTTINTGVTTINTCATAINTAKQYKTEMTASVQGNDSKHTRLKMNTFYCGQEKNNVRIFGIRCL